MEKPELQIVGGADALPTRASAEDALRFALANAHCERLAAQYELMQHDMEEKRDEIQRAAGDAIALWAELKAKYQLEETDAISGDAPYEIKRGAK
jgi:hypothetical protein